MPTMPEQRVILVPADHPAWTAIDDDDWSGHTLANWLHSYVKGSSVVIWPPPDYGDRLGRFLAALLNAGAERIVDGAKYPPDPGNFCRECFPLAQDIDGSLKNVRSMLKRFADAAEAAVSADAEAAASADAGMPTYESTMEEFENMLAAARQLLRETPGEPK